MQEPVLINSSVKVVAYYLPDSTRTKCLPRHMEYNNRKIIFKEIGLVHPTYKGKRMIHVFDMTDGQADYRLEFDAESLIWTLVYMGEAVA